MLAGRLASVGLVATVLLSLLALYSFTTQAQQPRDDMYVSCSGGGTVTAGTSHTVTCSVSNSTGRSEISWRSTDSGGVDVDSTSTSIDSWRSFTVTLEVTVNSRGTAGVSARDDLDSDSDSVSFRVSATPTPTYTPTPTNTPTPGPTPTPTATYTPTPTPTPRPGELSPPPPPQNVSARPVDSSRIRVSWTYQSGIEEYEINYRERGTSTWHSTFTRSARDDPRNPKRVPKAPSDKTVTGLKCNTTYEFRVSGLGDDETYSDDWSPWSDTDSATTHAGDPCPTPTHTPTPTHMPTFTPTATYTPTPTNTPIPTATPTNTAVPTATFTPTPTFTPRPTSTPSGPVEPNILVRPKDGRNMLKSMDRDECKQSIDHYMQTRYRKQPDRVIVLGVDWRGRAPTHKPNLHHQDHSYRLVETVFTVHTASGSRTLDPIEDGEWHADTEGCGLGPSRTVTSSESLVGTQVSIVQITGYKFNIHGFGDCEDCETIIATAEVDGRLADAVR